MATASLGVPVARAEGCAPASRISSCVDSDNLWFRPGSSQFASVGGTSLLLPGQMSFGLATTLQKRPIVLSFASSDPTGTKVAAIDTQLNATYLFSMGVSRLLELGAAIPTTLYQSGYGNRAFTDQTPGPVDRSVTRDLRLGATLSALSRSRATGEGLGLVARLEVKVPVGREDLYAGEAGWAFAPALASEWRKGRLHVGAEIGGRLRETTDLSGARVGSQIVPAAGITVDVVDRERLAVGAEAYAPLTLARQSYVVRAPSGALVDEGSRGALVPAEWMLVVRGAPALGGDLSVHAGFGTALSSAVTAPSWRATLGVRYAPEGRDRDGDGVLDRDDRCPNEPEDRDGFEDEDGCPDPDNDRDGIPDALDKCRDAPEDRDGFEDEDGCPDLDDDRDGVPDALDKCRNEPEDRDGFEDEDGCPDPDNDKDGIPDALDKCPNGPEDFDGFRDEDGCPDPDNDGDGIPDALDKCPDEAEDKDGFEDEDGCPDPDNDHDGVPDALDKCPVVPETIDGVDDEDGCPEPGSKDLVTQEGDRVVVVGGLRFEPNQAKMTKGLEAKLRMAAQKARSNDRLDRVIVEVYGDSGQPPAAAEKLAALRATAVRAVLVAAGLSNDVLTVATGDSGAKRSKSAPHVEVLVVRRRPPSESKPKPSAPSEAGGSR